MHPREKRLAGAPLAAAILSAIAAALLFSSAARAQTPTATPTPVPVATAAAGPLCVWEYTTALGNCAWFADAAGRTLYIVRGVSTKAGAQMIQIYDQAAAPPSGAPIAVYEAAASPAGNFEIRAAPEGITLRNGALVCNSTNSDPTAYTAGAADTAFEVCFR